MDAKEKIEIILTELEMKAPTFANSIGVPYQRIFDIQREKTKKISGDLAQSISAKYPQYNYGWLLSKEAISVNQKIGRIDNNHGNISGNVAGDVNIGCGERIKELEAEIFKQRNEIESLRQTNQKLLDQVFRLTDRLLDRN